MEKFRIAQYGCIQMVALAYGILSSGLLTKAAKVSAERGYSVGIPGHIETFYRDYGIFLSIIILAWASYCAFHSSTFSTRHIEEGTIVISGLVITGLFLISSTLLFCIGLVAMFYPSP